VTQDNSFQDGYLLDPQLVFGPNTLRIRYYVSIMKRESSFLRCISNICREQLVVAGRRSKVVEKLYSAGINISWYNQHSGQRGSTRKKPYQLLVNIT